MLDKDIKSSYTHFSSGAAIHVYRIMLGFTYTLYLCQPAVFLRNQDSLFDTIEHCVFSVTLQQVNSLFPGTIVSLNYKIDHNDIIKIGWKLILTEISGAASA